MEHAIHSCHLPEMAEEGRTMLVTGVGEDWGGLGGVRPVCRGGLLVGSQGRREGEKERKVGKVEVDLELPDWQGRG